MKITKKNLQNLIKEEINTVLKEQESGGVRISAASTNKLGRWYEMDPTFPSSGKKLPEELKEIGLSIENILKESYSKLDLEEAMAPQDKDYDEALKPVGEVIAKAGKSLVVNAKKLGSSIIAFLKKQAEVLEGGVSLIAQLGEKIGKAITVMLAADPKQHPEVVKLAAKIKQAEKDLADLDKDVEASQQVPKALATAAEMSFEGFKEALDKEIEKRRQARAKSGEASMDKTYEENLAKIPDDFNAEAKAAAQKQYDNVVTDLKRLMFKYYLKKTDEKGTAKKYGPLVVPAKDISLFAKYVEKFLPQVRLAKVDGQSYQWVIPVKTKDGQPKSEKFNPEIMDASSSNIKESKTLDNQLILENHRNGRGVHPAAHNQWWYNNENN